MGDVCVFNSGSPARRNCQAVKRPAAYVFRSCRSRSFGGGKSAHCVSKSNNNGRALAIFLKLGWSRFIPILSAEKRLKASRIQMEGPRERARCHRGLALALSGSEG